MEGLLLSCQSPTVGLQNLRQKIIRKPLQPRNFLVDPTDDQAKKNLKPKLIEISPAGGDSEKENRLVSSTPSSIGPLDASLAEELSAIRKKLERLRLDKEKTEKKLREKDLILDMHLMELQKRGESQKQLEVMVDKLLALKEIQSTCMRITPIQSLREKEKEKKLKEPQSDSQEMKADERECGSAMEMGENPELDPSADEVPEKAAPDS